ncbi:hypothetical protein [Nocardioides sp.]|uniref:hypothetical protein n=1 Tax=Nocardioides sp. TaxID=35761 RepID=UPI00261DD44F|nr:hypothetical protein [Nocardioides sp.]
MVWFRMDDGFDSHPKVLDIPRGAARLRAIGLWTSMGTWCARNLTDGKFGAHMVAEMGGNSADAKHLTRVNLWHGLGEGCGTKSCPAGVPGLMQVHDFLDQNPSKEEVLAGREAAAERQRKSREKKKDAAVSQRDVAVTHSDVTPVVTPTPTRPDPTRIKAAAAAEVPVGVDTAPTPPLPPALEILRNALEARKLVVRWDRLTTEQHTEIEALIELHGDAALVTSALRSYQANKPPAFAQAWLPGWRELRKPGDLALVSEPCPIHGKSGTATRCVPCISESIGVDKDATPTRKKA